MRFESDRSDPRKFPIHDRLNGRCRRIENGLEGTANMVKCPVWPAMFAASPGKAGALAVSGERRWPANLVSRPRWRFIGGHPQSDAQIAQCTSMRRKSGRPIK
jgi:hypothetical protein